MSDESSDPATDEKRLYPFSTEQLKTMFYLFVLGWTVWLLFQASNWDWDDQFFPYLVGIPLCLLIFVQLLKTNFDIFPSVGPEDTEAAFVDPENKADRTVPVRQRYELMMVAWVVAFPVSVYYLGFILVVPVYLFAFVWYFRRDLKQALLISVGGSISLYSLFVLLLGTPVWDGTLDVLIISLVW